MRAGIMAAALAALTLTVAPPAGAQEADRAALAREAVQLLEVAATFEQMMVDLSPILADGMANQLRLSRGDTERLQQILAEEFRASTPEMVEGIAGVYASGLSEPQLRELVTFLRSPTGREFVDIQNSAQSALDQLGERVGEQVGLRALQRLEQERGAK